MAIQVRVGSWWPRATRAITAVNKGASAIVMSTLATVVSARPSMKAVNITLQHRPAPHISQPPWRIWRHRAAGPRCQLIKAPSASPLAALRQKVISKGAAESRWRETTPAMLHNKVTSSMVARARR
jgi:hypothetical protein